MMAILRYAFLKSWRDRSLVAFMIFPLLAGVGPWVAMTLEQRAGRLAGGPSPRDIAEMSAMLGGTTAITLASILAFWTFRGEIANRSIGAFLFAARPLTIIASLILFATAVALAGTLVAEGSLTLLIGAPPSSHLELLAVVVLAQSSTAAAVGTLAVTISAQPTMLIGSLWGTWAMFLIPAIVKENQHPGHHGRLGEIRPELLDYAVWVVIAIVSAGIATILLRRRCAT